MNGRPGKPRIRTGGIAPAGGFTLIEGMVVVAILAIVAALAAPNFSPFIGTMNTKSAAFDLIGDLAMARSEALKRNVAITVAPIQGAWSKGWRILRPPVSPEAEPVALRERDGRFSSVSISAPSGGVVFQANGRLQNTDTATANVSWSITSSTVGALSRCVIVAPTGAARSKLGACS